jgi:hypothetical protein
LRNYCSPSFTLLGPPLGIVADRIATPTVTKHFWKPHYNASLQGDCEGPPDAEVLKARNTTVRAGDLKPGQCVLLTNQASFFTQQNYLWLENLHLHYLPEDNVTLPQAMMEAKESEVYMANMFFHGNKVAECMRGVCGLLIGGSVVTVEGATSSAESVPP